MKFIKEHKKISIIVLCSLMGFVLFTATFGKYIYNVFGSYILETKDFYFNSSVLNVNTKEYKINNWDGVNDYSITVDLNNIKNAFTHTETDIDYTATVSCSAGVSCSLSKNSGVIRENIGTDSFVINMVPNSGKKFSPGEEVEVNIEVTSTKPYKKILKGKFIISVETSSFSYEITDAKKNLFLTLNLTNSVSFYEVEQAFGKYKVGDVINLDEYAKLSQVDKDKCFSAKVTVTFDPNVINLDMTADAYLNKINGTESFKNIGGFKYINSFQFKIDATSSEKIIFYKLDKTKDFTYPIVNQTSIIDVNVKLAK